MGAYSKILVAFKKYPLIRGMAAYSIIWPTSSIIQQTFEGKSIDDYDWWRCARFGLYGSCFVAPTLYSWLTVANVMWPGSTIRAALIKVWSPQHVTYIDRIEGIQRRFVALLERWECGPAMADYSLALEHHRLLPLKQRWLVANITLLYNVTFVETISYTPFAMCSFYFGMSLLEMKPLHEAVSEVKAKFWPTYKVGASIWPVVAMINFSLIPPKNRVPFISVCSLVWTCFLAYMKHLDKEIVVAKAGQSPVHLLKMT